VAADEIVANDVTLTGSIGVFALRPAIGEALAKLGVNVDSLTRGKYADFMLSSRPLSDGAKKRLQSMVYQTYDLFVSRVAEGRDMELAEVDRVGQGRVWTGRQAYEIGLVDHLGGLHTALGRVRHHLGLDAAADLALVVFPPPRSLGEELSDALDVRLASLVEARWPMPEALRGIRSWLAGLRTEGPLAVPPYLVEIR
jgi:protease-4